jgi:hypothetical protein
VLKYSLLLCLLGCNLGPRVDDVEIDAAPGKDSLLLPPDAIVPSVATNPELVTQIQFNDGLLDTALVMTGGVVTRGTAKSGGATVRFWHFGPAPFDTFSVLAPIYIFGRVENGSFKPLTEHPPLLDTIPGDLRYSPMRRVLNMPVTAAYKGEKITSLGALNEAVERGLVEDPIVEGTWINMPVVPPGTKLEVSSTATLPAKQVYARGYLVDVFELGTSLGRQPLRLGIVNVLHASFLQSGVPTGTPPVLSTVVDAQPVLQQTIPTEPPTMTQTYSPLADSVAPSAITSDADLFRRTATGVLNGFRPDNVHSFTIGTIVNNIQIQFTEGAP